MKLSEFNALLSSTAELPERVESRLRAARASSLEKRGPCREEAELGRRLVNPYVREIILSDDARASLQVTPEFDLPMGAKVWVKRVDGEASWVYGLDGEYNRRGQLLEEV